MVANLMKRGSKAWLIWLSCMDKPRSLKEIMNAWGYKAGAGALYRIDIINKMMAEKIISVAHVGKENLYKSDFGWLNKSFWLKMAKQERLPDGSTDVVTGLINDNFAAYFNQLELKKEALFKLDSIKIFYKNNYGLLKLSPLLMLKIPVSVYIYYSLTEPKKRAYEEGVKKAIVLQGLTMTDLIGYVKTIDESKLGEYPDFIQKFDKKMGMF